MNDALLMLTAAALTGIASRSRGGHGVEPRPAADIAREAVELARTTLAEIGADLDKPAPRQPERVRR